MTQTEEITREMRIAAGELGAAQALLGEATDTGDAGLIAEAKGLEHATSLEHGVAAREFLRLTTKHNLAVLSREDHLASSGSHWTQNPDHHDQ